MKIRHYEEFIDTMHADNYGDLALAMRKEIKLLLAEFGQAYDTEASPDKELRDCTDNIMNLIIETKHEW